jgi:tRNA G18 (ribose-2'-O)-methylase SpoU
MPRIRIASLDDPSAALYSGVREPHLLHRHRLFVAEGRLVVERLIADRRYRLRSLLLNDASFDALQPALTTLASDVDILLAGAEQFQAIAGFNFHRGCLALAERPRPQTMAQAIGGGQLIVALEHVTDADNVGSVFRNAAAFKVDAVLLSPSCCDPLYRKSIRTSMGASLQVPFARVMHWERGLDWLGSEGFTRVALTPASAADTLNQFCANRSGGRLAIFVGTEGAGLTPATLARTDRQVRIPMAPAVDSLNLAAATAIVLSRLHD